jgi:hypothetical protein
MVTVYCSKCKRPIAFMKEKPKRKHTCMSCNYNLLLDKRLKKQNDSEELWKRYEEEKSNIA